MAAAVSTVPYRWLFVSGGGARVRIYAGPLIHAAPVQWVQFAQVAFGASSASMTFTVTAYSAAPPFYFVSTGPATAWRNTGSPGAPAIGRAPWDAGFPLWMVASPWTEVFVSTSLTCFANLFVP